MTWLLWLMLLTGIASAQELQPVPPLTAHVIDTTGTLDSREQQALEAKLAAFEQAKGSQLVVLMVASTEPEDIASYANRVANSWKIGRKEVGDGLLVVVAKNDRKVRIEVAKALEGAIPDLAARHIIEQALTPQFKNGAYTAGLNAAVDQLMARISGEALPEPVRQSRSSGLLQGFEWMDLAVFLFFAVPVGGAIARSLLGRKLGAVLTGAGVGVLAWVVTTSLLVAAFAALAGLLFALFSSFTPALRGRSAGRGGWGSGGGGRGGWSSGGGFSAGGGGDFGGGGASGDW